MDNTFFKPPRRGPVPLYRLQNRAKSCYILKNMKIKQFKCKRCELRYPLCIAKYKDTKKYCRDCFYTLKESSNIEVPVKTIKERYDTHSTKLKQSLTLKGKTFTAF